MEKSLEGICDALCKRIEDDIQVYNHAKSQHQESELKTGAQVKCKTELERIATGVPNSLSDIGNPHTPDHTSIDDVPGITENYFFVYKRGVRRPILQLVLSCDEEGFGISHFEGEQNRWLKLDAIHPVDQISSMLLEKHLLNS